MADIRKDERFEEFLQAMGFSVAEFEALETEVKAILESDIESWKRQNPREGEPETGYSIPEAVNIATNKNLNMMPEDLVNLNNTLKDAAKVDENAAKAYNNVQMAINIKTNQYINGEISIDIDNVDSMLAMIDALDIDRGMKNRVAEETNSDLIELLEKNGLTLDDYNKSNQETKDWIRKEMRTQYNAEVVAFLEMNNISIEEYTSSGKEIKDWVKNEIQAQKDADIAEFLETNNISFEEYNVANQETKDWVDREIKAQNETNLKAYLAKKGISEEEYSANKELQIMTSREMQKEKQLEVFLEKNGLTLDDYNKSDSETRSWADKEMQKDRDTKSAEFRNVVTTAPTTNLDYKEDVQPRTIKDVAREKVEAFAAAYDEENGLTGLNAENSEYLDTNSIILEGIGEEDLLATEAFKEQPVQPMAFEKAKEVIANNTFANLNLQEFASLQAAMEVYSGSFTKENRYVVSKAARDKVLDIVDKKAEFGKEDLAGLDKIIKSVENAAKLDEKLIKPKKLEKAKDILNDARDDVASTMFTKDPEMQEAYDVLSAIKVTGKLKGFTREELQQRDTNGNFLPDSEMGLFIESIKEQTKRQMLVGKEEITPEAFKTNFTDNLQLAVFELYNVERIALGKSTAKDAKEAYDNFINMGQKGKRISINYDSFAGYAAAKNKESNSFLNRLQKKVGDRKAVVTARDNHNKLDKKNEKTHGEKYKKAKLVLRAMGKAALKTAAWSLAFSAAASLGPYALAGVAAASLGNQVMNIRKEYKNAKIDSAKQGKKLTLRKYFKQNPSRGIGLFTGALSVAIPGMEIAGKFVEIGNLATTMSPHLMTARMGGAGLGAATGLWKPIQRAFSKKTKSSENTLGLVSALGATAVGFGTGMVVGNYANEFISDHFNTSPQTETTPNTSTVQQDNVNAPFVDMSSQNYNFRYIDNNDASFLFSILSGENALDQQMMAQDNTYINKFQQFDFQYKGPDADVNLDSIVDKGGPAWDRDNDGTPDYIQRPASQMEPAQDVREAPEQTQERPAQNRAEIKETQVPEKHNSEQIYKAENSSAQNPPAQDNQAEAKDFTLEERTAEQPLQQNFEPTAEELAQFSAQDRANAEQDFANLEAAYYEKSYEMTDSIGQKTIYQVDAEGNVIFTDFPEGFSGHQELANDIAKSIMDRVDAGNATEGDIKALGRYTGDQELVDAAQVKYDAAKEEFIESRESHYAETRAEETAEAQTLVSNEDTNNINTSNDNQDETPIIAANINETQNNSENQNEVVQDKSDENQGETKEDEQQKAVPSKGIERSVADDGTITLETSHGKSTYRVWDENGTTKFHYSNDSKNVPVPSEIAAQREGLFQTKNGDYRVGDKTYSSITEASQAIQTKYTQDSMNTMKAVIRNDVYNDMVTRENSGEILSQAEKNFMVNHENNLENLGLARDENGQLAKADLIKYEQQIASNEVITRSVGEGKNSFSYKIDENGRNSFVENSPKVDSMSKGEIKVAYGDPVKNLETGKYEIGGIEASSSKAAVSHLKIELEQTYKNHEVYKDLASQEKVTVNEAKFMAAHEQRMSSHNLTVDKEGNLATNTNANEPVEKFGAKEGAKTYSQTRDEIREKTMIGSGKASRALGELHQIASIIGSYTKSGKI